jgi:hypothetical protein
MTSKRRKITKKDSLQGDQSTPDAMTNSMAPFIPTLEEWRAYHGRFREALNQLYKSPNSRWDNDTAFCGDTGLSRAQFSRVMQGNEKPSQNIMVKLRDVLPDVYDACERRWLEERDTTDAQGLVNDMWRRVGTSFPGTFYVLTSRPLEQDAEILLRSAARFLEEDQQNRLTFIVGNVSEDWAQRYPPDRSLNTDKINGWPVIDQDNIGGYIDDILDLIPDSDMAQRCAEQIHCFRVSFLDIPSSDRQASSRLEELLACQLLSPTQIWMLYVGSKGELIGVVYVRFGSRYRWFPLSHKEADALLRYVNALQEMQATAPEIIKQWSIEGLSSRFRRLKSTAQIN